MSDAPDISAFLRSLDREALPRVVEAARRALDQAGEHVLAAAAELTPVSPTDPNHPLYIGTSGSLRDSRTALPATTTSLAGTGVEKLIGFNTDYAAAVHERLDLVHQYPGAVNPQAQAKFLETAARDNVDRVTGFVLAEMRKAL